MDDYDYDYIIDEYKLLGNNMKWTMKDGKKIPIKNMDSSHIKNCIIMIKNNKIHRRDAWINIFNNELMNRRYYKLNKILGNINEYKTR